MKIDPDIVGTNTAEEARQYAVFIQSTLESPKFRQSMASVLNRIMVCSRDDRMNADFIHKLHSAAMQAKALSDTLRSMS